MSGALILPEGVSIDHLMRLTAIEVLTTYGPEVSDLVARLQASGMVPHDGRTAQDLVAQAEMQALIAEQGDCGVADAYKAALEDKREQHGIE